MQDKLEEYGELGLGSRLKRLSEQMMKEIQLVYDAFDIDFDPYLFPIFRVIIDKELTTTTDIQEALQYTQPAITQALKKLMDKQYVTYKVDKTDKRKKLFKLTKKGKDTHLQMIPLWKVIDQQVKWLTEGSATSLTRHLTYMEDQLKQKSLSHRILEKFK
ncbi:MarR family winged helix-turn-helix transcriptional regulator [Aquimarina sp. 2201CG5-10]|uniref:MarR family winged helix-turn-helix transcriptional regulator n=1 Tax=Aquimarina callyspongiae TaxID=3098150 RepID=UPI002AB5AC1E|nr:transcriptional regulator [Aquimarina sp. 2201CG5-10]MDY8136771.1 transcriptional regulator [Aquimarina sp. 2201CG5-10]